ncbi:hypothetical protein M3J09_004909 [Ascochyta lentis]
MFCRMQMNSRPEHICGLYYSVPCFGGTQRVYLPQVEVNVHASILATTSRTVLKQTFANPSTARGIREVRYAFPLYDGVSVVGFSCQIGNRTIVGQVKEKENAKAVFKDAVARGETAGLLEQLPQASDVFTTTIGNIPPGARVVVNITYLGELKHDMEVDGIRFTIPTSICPRYGSVSAHFGSLPQLDGVISITVDAETAEGSFIQRLQSPTHPISMSMGTTSVNPDAAPSMSKASATLSLGTAHLETDFVLQVIAKDTGIPKAILETHPSIPNHRALMTTLVPKFALPGEKPEIVFVCDQSGSMGGPRMNIAIEALQVFLKSLPVGVKFNICSFGTEHSFMLPRSASYTQETLDFAVQHAEGLQANYGGTELLRPLRATIENRYKDMPLDIILLTDGETWDQQEIFNYLNEQTQDKKAPVRVFTLGIGSGVSHSLVEGVAKAGNGFSQTVQEGEKMSSKVVRMLKGALSPHVNDYTLEVKYSAAQEDDFQIVEKVADSLRVKLDLKDEESGPKTKQQKKPISLFDASADLDDTLPTAKNTTAEERYAHLVPIPAPKILQAPQQIPSLFAFNRTTVYLLLGPEAPRATPTSVILRGTSTHGPLELEIPIQVLDTPGETIHQLAAKKAVSELEQGRGWLAAARDTDGQLLKTRFDGRFSDMVEREAVRLGMQFQVGGKWCSFVATEKTPEARTDEMGRDWEYLEDERHPEQQMQQQQLFAQGQQQQQRQMQQQQLFGHAQQQQNSQQGTRLFGSTPHASGRGGGGLFGLAAGMGGTGGGGARTAGYQNPNMMMPQNQQQYMSQGGSSLFGSSYSSAAPQSLRKPGNEASHSQTTGPAFGQSSAPTSLFGGNGLSGFSRMEKPTFEQNIACSSSPFGDVNASSHGQTTKPAFGQTGATPSLFGSIGGLFGSSSSQTANQATGQGSTGSSLFGGQGGLFGSSSSQAANQATGQGNTGSSLFGGQGGLFGSSSSQTANQASGQCNTGPSLFGHAAPSNIPSAPTANALQDYQMQCMMLEQQNKDRLHMSKQPPSTTHSTSEQPISTPPHSTLLHLLIKHQSFNGSFAYNTPLLAHLGPSIPEFTQCLQNAGLEPTDSDELFTALVVVYMEQKMPEFRGAWELVVEKARGWLGAVRVDQSTTNNNTVSVGELLKAAGTLVGE